MARKNSNAKGNNSNFSEAAANGRSPRSAANNQRNNKRGKRGSSKHGNSNFGGSNGHHSTGAAPTSSLNDISWYTRHPELLAAAAQVPFPNRPGMILDAGELTSTFISEDQRPFDLPTNAKIRIPGVMAINYMYSWGYSDGPNSPASIAAAELWSVIRSKFSGSLDEDAPDLFMYCCAIDQIHAYIAWLKRLYKCSMAYSANNYEFPRTLMKAMLHPSVLEPEDINRNKMRLWSDINELVNMVNVFNVPDTMSVYARHRWMNENVYLDAPDMNSQAYVFNPDLFYMVDDASETGTRLYPFDLATSLDNFDSLFEIGAEMIRHLKEWDDAYTINGHIQRAFEGSTMYRAELLDQNESIIPVYVPEVLTQIENLRTVGDLTSLWAPDMTQDPETNAIIFCPNAHAHQKVLPTINLHSVQPTAAEVTIATRLAPVTDSDGRVDCATEIPTSITLFSASANDGTSDNHVMGHLTSVNSVNTAWDSPAHFQMAFDTVRSVVALQAWQHAPMVWLVLWDDNFSAPALDWYKSYGSILSGDYANITVINRDVAANLHRVCVYSEFDCFNRGK